MVTDSSLTDTWIPRLAAARRVSVLGPGGPIATDAPQGRVSPAATTRLDALTGGDPVGLHLVAVAATRLAVASVADGPQHAVLLPAPRPAQRPGELALCAPLIPADPVARFLTALHQELESATALAWPDRSLIVRRLEAAGLPLARALSDLAVVCEGTGGTDLAPVTVALSVRRDRGGLVTTVSSPQGRLPLAAWSLARCVAAAMAAIAADPHQRCQDVDLLGDEQRAELKTWSGLPCPRTYPADTLTNVTDTIAARLPDREAVSDGRVTWSHHELRERSSRAGRLLARRHGVRRGDRVALLLPRGPGLILAIMAVLRAGASYVPLDPAHPPARLARQLKLSRARCVISGESRPPDEVGLPTVAARELADAPADTAPLPGPFPDDEAVLFFTSGSTGLPRPVALTHRQLTHKVTSSGSLIGFDDRVRCAVLSAISSDALTYQVFTTLAAGGCLVPVDAPQELAPADFWALLAAHRVNTLNCVPSLLSAMAEGVLPDRPQRLRICLLGGDAIPVGMLPRLADRLRVETFANLYGPTEATVEATTFRCAGDRFPDLATVPIGRPSPGYAVLVLTERGDHAPIGVPGEIHVLGPGVAEGYLDDAPTGPHRFHRLPSHPGLRAFRTGDFGRWRPDSQLEFLGRRDNQIQVHGNRVELGEIEAVLSGLPGVGAAAVVPVAEAGGPPTIAAAYTAGTDLSPTTVRALLAEHLPGYMVPGQVLKLRAMPLTPHGKVDRKALLAHVAATGDRRWEPADTWGRMVLRAWTETLGRPPRSATEDLFAAGGHSLTAVQLAGRLCRVAGGEVITVREVFGARTPGALAAVLQAAARPDREAAGAPRRRTGAPDRIPASNAQRRMWFLEQYEEGELRPYVMVEAFRLKGAFGASAVAAAMRDLVRRHPALRTVLRAEGDELYQVVLPPEQAPMEMTVPEVPPGEAPRMLRRLIAAAQRHRVDLSNGPMLRAWWLAEAEDSGILVLSVHHSVCDGWSIAVMLRDLLRLLPGNQSPPGEPTQYGTYCAEPAARHSGAAGRRALAFWRHTLDGLPQVELPLDRPRPLDRSSAAGVVRLPLGEETAGRLRELCRSLGATPFQGMVAAVRVLLYRLCQSDDVPLGTVVAGRDAPGLADAVGLFANTVVLRTRLDPRRGFRDLVTAVARTAEESRPHGDYPFESLVEELAAERVAGRNPLFDVLVESVLSGTSPLGPEDRAGSLAEQLEIETETEGFDLTFGFSQPDAGPLEAWLTYRRDVWDHGTVRRMGEQLRHLLRGLLADPEAPVATVTCLPDEQRALLLSQGRGPLVAYSGAATLLELVARQVTRRPDSRAVICDGLTLSFADLDRLADDLAGRLAAAADTGPGRVVAFACERSVWMVVTLMAIVKTGSAFVPLDPGQPAVRLARIIRDSGATAVVADAACSGSLSGAEVPLVLVDGGGRPSRAGSRSHPAAGASDLAYLIYTSGTTGVPKGVMVEHRGIVNTARYRMDYYDLGPGSCVLQVDPLHCDAGIADVFTALGSGAPLVVVSREQMLDPDKVAAIVRREGVTHCMLVPSLYQLLLDYAGPALGSLRQIVLGGERVTGALASRHAALLPATELYNEYGPAEDSVATTLHRVATGGAEVEVPVGRPLANKWVDLLDKHGELVPHGVTGEICIGGAGLARGYQGDAELTARRFVPSPVRPGKQMYRTGDLARRLPDGQLLFLGRVDDQVKIRGNRVEPGEVAAVLSQAPGVRNAAVVATPGPAGEARLVAYVAGDAGPSALREFLAQRLPGFMMPDGYVRVAELPVTANGKLDRTALPPPSPPADVSAAEGGAVLSPAEQRVADLWSRILQQPVTDPDTSLFALGGHSLAAARIAQELGVPVRTVFTHQTVRALAGAVGNHLPASGTPPTASPRPHREAGGSPLSHAQRRVWLASSRASPDAFTISDLVRLGRRLDPAALRSALAAVVARQEMLRAQVRSRGTSAELLVLERLAGVPLVVEELPGADPHGPEVRAALQRARAVPFRLEQAPLFEVRLISGPAGGDLLTVTAHHLIYDGASVEVLLRDLFTAYDQAGAGRPPALPGLGFTYRDWIVEEQRWLGGSEARRQELFWRKRLAGARPAPDLVDAGRRGIRRGSTGLARRMLPEGLVTSASHTPYAMVVASFAALVHRTTGACDLVLGFPASLRDHPGADALVGYLANAVPLRLEFSPKATLGDLLTHVQERILEAYEHSRLPFDVLAERLGLHAAPGRGLLLDLGVSWENAAVEQESYLTEDVLPQSLPAGNDLWLYASRRGGRLHLDLTYDDHLLTADEAHGFVDRLAELVSEVATRPDAPLAAAAPHRRPGHAWADTRYDL